MQNTPLETGIHFIWSIYSRKPHIPDDGLSGVGFISMEQINFVCCIPKLAAICKGVGKAMRKLHIDDAFNKISSDEHNFREM